MAEWSLLLIPGIAWLRYKTGKTKQPVRSSGIGCAKVNVILAKFLLNTWLHIIVFGIFVIVACRALNGPWSSKQRTVDVRFILSQRAKRISLFVYANAAVALLWTICFYQDESQ